VVSLPEPRAWVRLTDDAVEDLRRLQKKDPQIVREVFKKMLLLERSPSAGETLLGALVGFRKLVVGDRDYRIVWQETTDQAHRPVLEIAEVWAVGARADSEVYAELTRRVEQLKTSGHPQVRALVDVIEQMGRLYGEVDAHPKPSPPPELPSWLAEGLRTQLHLSRDAIEALSEQEAKQLLMEHWSQPPQ
jgi:mRNA interferase RelE/StbE